MKTITLTKNRVAVVDDADYDTLIQYFWSVSSAQRR